jgi:ferric-dicitrate binding protein FerR (iron transport regulator)
VAEPDVTWVTKFNPKGQKSKIHLPDGSTVIMNADSEIKFKTDFGVTNREIFMTGESFFEVAPDSLMPFRVFSEELVTTALGTSFNIDSYDPEHIRVQLATGKVEISGNRIVNEKVLLEPGEELRTMGGQTFRKGKFDPSKAFLWKLGILLFNDASLSAFQVTLERWYGVEIEVVNAPEQSPKISGEFKDTYLSNVLEAVGYAYGFEYKIDQKKVKLVFTN